MKSGPISGSAEDGTAVGLLATDFVPGSVSGSGPDAGNATAFGGLVGLFPVPKRRQVPAYGANVGTLVGVRPTKCAPCDGHQYNSSCSLGIASSLACPSRGRLTSDLAAPVPS